MVKENKTQKNNTMQILGVVLLIIGILMVILPLAYIALTYYVFNITIFGGAGLKMLAGWLLNKMISIIMGLVLIIYSVKLIKTTKK